MPQSTTPPAMPAVLQDTPGQDLSYQTYFINPHTRSV